MDILRHGKTKKVWLDAARTKSTVIRWYEAPKGAKVFPHPHNYGAETWDTCHWYNDGVGEDDLVGYAWDNFALKHPYKGIGFAGDPSWFALGQPSDAPPLAYSSTGMPIACGARGAYSDAYSEAWDVFRGR